MKIFAVLLAALVASFGIAHAAPLSQFTGPAGTNPAANPQVVPDLNQLIVNLNSALSPAGIFTGGGVNFQVGIGSGSTMTLVGGPALATGVGVKFYLTFNDSQGKVSYIPVFQ